MLVLEIKDLSVKFGATEILRGVNLKVEQGQTLGIVGESGCGKSMTAFAAMGMVPPPGRIAGGSILLEGTELVKMNESQLRKVRGSRIALVMQDPFTSLNPMMTVGSQIAEVLEIHHSTQRRVAIEKAVELLNLVGVPAPELSARKYPHEMSGGQRQRVVIAMAFACRPEVLIADEPTTALDVTLQAQILRLLRDLQDREGTAVMLISHDIQAIASVSHQVAVFYGGRVVETGTAEQVLKNPAMPYTKALLNAMPRRGQTKLEVIPGQPPKFNELEPGCSFAPRCPYRIDKCSTEPNLEEVDQSHFAACWKAGRFMEANSC